MNILSFNDKERFNKRQDKLMMPKIQKTLLDKMIPVKKLTHNTHNKPG